MRLFIFMTYLLHVTFAAPQFVTFKDGKVGVNFGGYHAEAGLGGLLTGNAAHGGLSASAGTPWGPNAAAGLNGGVDGRASGLAYAGAQYNPSVGASTVLGGTTGQNGIAASEAHANGKTHTKTLFVEPLPPAVVGDNYAPKVESTTDGIQRIKPPVKKYTVNHPSRQDNIVHSKQLIRTVHGPVMGAVEHDIRSNDVQPEIVRHALGIPIGILNSLQDTLTALGKTIQSSRAV